MKSSWYATLAIVAALVLGSLVGQSFGGDKGFAKVGRAGGGQSFAQKVQGGSAPKFSGGSMNTIAARKLGGASLGGFPGKPPIVKPTFPVTPVGPVKPPIGPIGPIKPPVGPVKPPVGPIGPIKPPVGPIKPPVGPIGPIGPIKPPIGPIKPPIGPIGPIKPPIGPITPLPPICPPKPCPPICPPHYPGGYCGPWYPLPGFWGCHHHCPPVCITLPAYCGYPCVVTETIVVEGATTPVLVSAQVVEDAAEAKLMQVPVGATLTLADKNLGAEEGQVVLEVQSVSLPAKVNEWKADKVNATLPLFGLAAPTKAKIWLLRKDGQVANTVMVELIPATPESQQAAAQAAANQAAAQQ